MLTFGQSLGAGAALAFVLFTATWLLSRKLNNYSFVDITWSYSFTVVASLYAAISKGALPRRLTLLAMVAFWSLRLGTHILKRVVSHHPHEDVRYATWRKKATGSIAAKFFGVFQFQAALVLVLSIVFLVAMRNPDPHFALLESIGIAVWLIGVLGEATADAQMRRFKADAANEGKVCDVGLWRYSRHPNYFFESVIWWGFWLFACGTPWGWVTIFAPLLMLYFLLFVTGIPLTEKCSVESKGDLYRQYQRTTSAFIPWFPRRIA
jgi:steroid 5-alpha reductase family enzyme